MQLSVEWSIGSKNNESGLHTILFFHCGATLNADVTIFPGKPTNTRLLLL